MVAAKHLFAALGAAALAIQPQAAAAQGSCVTEAEVGAMALYAMPQAIQAVRLGCSGQLSSNGYLARHGDELIASYTALQDRNWPGAKSALLKLVTSGLQQQPSLENRGVNLDLIRQLPDNAVRPLVEAMVVQKLQPIIKPESCGRIERVVEAIAPVQPEIAGKLIGVISGLVELKQPSICPVD
ncbi:conserved hypothetical protein [Altererythrobacter sp. B11]|uniref:hypothetical protein n=1 Tax=Altererythrobacter sp. B11 TaxID=2060312 RepID=UPI000DC7354A|nr:hypothetical protein [Altererythrobacter sp. B11]BBC73146.1 conserved hypothetical protein [Altererythrobacter sp. B11]